MRYPLSVFEHYMFTDDSTEYPMTFFQKLELSGTIDKSHLEKAIRLSLKKNPLLTSIINGSPLQPTRKLFWTVIENPSLYIYWLDSEEEFKFPDDRGHIDIQKNIGVRFWIRQNSLEKHTVIIQVHHACTDESGILLFIEDIFNYYQNLSSGSSYEKMKSDLPDFSQILNKREIYKYRILELFHALFNFPNQLFFLLKNSVSPLSIPKVRNNVDTNKKFPFPSLNEINFSEDQTQSLIHFSRGNGISLNDYLSGCLVMSCKIWNSLAGIENHRIRLAIPVDLRQPHNQELPSCNIVSMAFLDFMTDEISDLKNLVNKISSDMKEQEKYKIYTSFIRVLRSIDLFRGVTWKRIRTGGCRATTVFSNIMVIYLKSELLDKNGEISSSTFIMDECTFVPPIRSKTHMVFSAVTYCGNLKLTGFWDRRLYSKENEQEFMNIFYSQINSLSQIQQPDDLEYSVAHMHGNHGVVTS